MITLSYANIPLIRKKRGITQKELALQLGINPVTLNRIEKGSRTPGVNLLAAMADVLNCTMDELCGRNFRDS